jgi:two-component sensor histidine kinase
MRSVRVADILAELAAGTSVLHPGADLRTEADAALMLDADRAIPLTLVLNELVAAALSSGEEGAVVRLSAAATGDGGGVAVTVTGLGAWPPPVDAVGGAGDLAETMVRGLLRQIGATLEVRAEDGAAVVAVPGEAAGGTAAAAAPAA